MYAMLEKYGLTALVTLVTIMFLTYFGGVNVLVPHAAIAAFAAISLAMIIEQYKDQFAMEA